MNRGKKKYRCGHCGHVFTAMDMEWNATAFPVPQPCPKCGSLCVGDVAMPSLGSIAKTVTNLLKTTK